MKLGFQIPKRARTKIPLRKHKRIQAWIENLKPMFVGPPCDHGFHKSLDLSYSAKGVSSHVFSNNHSSSSILKSLLTPSILSFIRVTISDVIQYNIQRLKALIIQFHWISCFQHVLKQSD